MQTVPRERRQHIRHIRETEWPRACESWQHRNICKSIISEHHHSPCNSSLQALPLCSYHCECFKNRQTPQHRFCAAFLINLCIRSEWFCVAPASLSSKENNLKIAVDQKTILIPFPPPAAVANGSHGVLASSRVSGTGWGAHRIEKTRGRNSSWVIAFIRFCGAFLEPQDTARYMGWSSMI